MKELLINRKDWIRGKQGYGISSALLRASDQKMCCLGFYLRSCGIEDITDLSSPGQLYGTYTKEQEASSLIPDWLLEPALGFAPTSSTDTPTSGKINTTDCNRLMDINDSHDPSFLTEEQRETEIKELFLLHGVKVTFVN